MTKRKWHCTNCMISQWVALMPLIIVVQGTPASLSPGDGQWWHGATH